jgi:predicted TIM-barrel fold metal-dependent hydrolase
MAAATPLSSTSPESSFSRYRPLAERIPYNAWDSHMHVVDPANYPLSPDASYTPEPHLLSDAVKFEQSVGIQNIVLVQPSIYGNDNSCMLDALRQLGPQRGRAVVAFDPATIDSSTLQEWHHIGVRGVRVNLQSVGKKMDDSSLAALLRQYADIIRPFNWVLQLYISLAAVEGLEKIVPGLGVRVCVDHFGNPTLPDPKLQTSYSSTTYPYSLPGFGSLINLLRQGSTYVKVSAPYRISKMEDQSDVEPIAKELLRVAPTRLVFATDWPHTRFSGLDIKPFMENTLRWCEGNEDLTQRLFTRNAEELWGVDGKAS